MFTIRVLILPDRSIYILLQGGDEVRLYLFSAVTGDFEPVTGIFTRDWHIDEVQIQQKTIV